MCDMRCCAVLCDMRCCCAMLCRVVCCKLSLPRAGQWNPTAPSQKVSQKTNAFAARLSASHALKGVEFCFSDFWATLYLWDTVRFVPRADQWRPTRWSRNVSQKNQRLIASPMYWWECVFAAFFVTHYGRERADVIGQRADQWRPTAPSRNVSQRANALTARLSASHVLRSVEFLM